MNGGFLGVAHFNTDGMASSEYSAWRHTADELNQVRRRLSGLLYLISIELADIVLIIYALKTA
jgi:hypothetical protein